MNAIREINHTVKEMCKKAQVIAPPVHRPEVYRGAADRVGNAVGRRIGKAIDKIPERLRDHAVNMYANINKGYWNLANNIIPETPKYIARLLGGTLGGISGALGGKRDGGASLSYLAGLKGDVGDAARAVQPYAGAAKDAYEGARMGADALSTIVDENWSKPVHRFQDKYLPWLKSLEDGSSRLVDELGTERKIKSMGKDNPYAYEDFQASQIAAPSTALAAAAGILGKATGGFGSAGNALKAR